MNVSKLLALQLREPKGLVGKIFISRILNSENAGMNDLTLALLNLEKTDNILEVGFGGGDLLSKILNTKPGEIVFGVDISKDMVARCRKTLRKYTAKELLKLDCFSVNKLPYESNQFTKICSVNTIYFWESCSKAIKELNRVLDDRGTLVITFGDKESMSKEAVCQYGFHLYTSENVQSILKSEGFIIDKIEEGNDKSGKFFAISAVKMPGKM